MSILGELEVENLVMFSEEDGQIIMIWSYDSEGIYKLLSEVILLWVIYNYYLI